MNRQGAAVLLLAACLIGVFPTHAQEDPVPVIQFGEVVSGNLDERTPREVFAFEGRRGEVLSLNLNITGGDLDPILTITDADGTVLSRMDDGRGRGALIENLRIPATSQYLVVLGRFGYDLGTTRGDYEMTLNRVGVSSESGSSLRYGDSIINNVTDSSPQLYYSFLAQRGDILNVRMQRVSGDLDPFVMIANSEATVLASSDDIPGSSSLDAAVEGFVVEQDGPYVIIATRYGQAAGISSGSFVLSIDETDDSGVGNTVQTARELSFETPLEDEITGERFEQFFTFRAVEDEIIDLRMDRLSGSLDATLTLLDDDLRELAFNDDGGGGQNAQIIDFRVPETGLYYVRAARFNGQDGGTVGRFRLSLEQQGSAFVDVPAQVPRIIYGTTVTGVIDDNDEQAIYAFWGVEGDVVTVSMNRGDGNLDPVVSILNDIQRPLVSDDDSGGGQNARIDRFLVQQTGVYYVLATRYTGSEGDPDTRGSYILVLARRPE